MTKHNKISYEPEADVLRWELNDSAQIDSAREVGNIVVHFTEQNIPVLIEILEASSFLDQAEQLLARSRGQSAAAAKA